MYPVSVYFGMFIQFLKNIFYSNGIDEAAEGLDEGTDVDLFFFFERINTEENPFLFATTLATNIP